MCRRDKKSGYHQFRTLHTNESAYPYNFNNINRRIIRQAVLVTYIFNWAALNSSVFDGAVQGHLKAESMQVANECCSFI